MPNPAAGEVLQNVVINPVPQQQQQDPQAPPRPAQDNQVLNLLVNPAFQMNAAERIGINNIVNEFLRAYQNNFAPQINEFQGAQGLERATFWICREIDTMRMIGNSYNGMLASEPYLRRIATAGSYGILPQPVNVVAFENLPFATQMYLMNLTIFILRYLNNHPQA
jgi:hypothetical protein